MVLVKQPHRLLGNRTRLRASSGGINAVGEQSQRLLGRGMIEASRILAFECVRSSAHLEKKAKPLSNALTMLTDLAEDGEATGTFLKGFIRRKVAV